MTTVEFCDKFNIPYPVFTGEVKSTADQFLQIEAIKQRMFVEYAKFLNKEITLDMFRGERKLFSGYEIQDQKNWVDFYGGIRVYQPSDKPDAWSYVFRNNKPPKIADLVGSIECYNEY